MARLALEIGFLHCKQTATKSNSSAVADGSHQERHLPNGHPRPYDLEAEWSRQSGQNPCDAVSTPR